MKTKQKIFFGILVAAVLWIVLPFISYLAMGAIFAVLAYPAYAHLKHLRQWSPAKALTAVTSGILVLVLFPLVVLVFSGIRAATQQIPHFLHYLESLIHKRPEEGFTPLQQAWESLGLPSIIEISNLNQYALDFARTAGGKLTGFLGTMASEIPSMGLGIAIMVLGMILCLYYSETLTLLIRKHSFFTVDGTERLITLVQNTTRSIFLATIFTGIVQSVVFSLGCLILGIKNVVLVGFLVFLGSLFPAGGTLPVTLSIALYKTLAGPTYQGVILFALAVAVSFVDNLIRPMVLQSGASFDPLLSVIAILCGLVTLGFPGLFLGPLAFIVVNEVYKLVYVDDKKADQTDL